MACCQPIKIKNIHFGDLNYKNSAKQYLEVPCGWCLNCRCDKQKFLTDCAEQEYKDFDYHASFCFFSYDEDFVPSNIDLLDYDIDEFGNITYSQVPQYTLRYMDIQLLNKRLRKNIQSYYLKNHFAHLDDNNKFVIDKLIPEMNPNFKFLACSEYGDNTHRCHYHVIYFGLDHMFCRSFIKDNWKFGFSNVLPIESGAFRYITKYMTKQSYGKEARELYDEQKIERPRVFHSLHFGGNLIKKNLSDIKKHNACYPDPKRSNKYVPLNKYYQNKYLLKKDSYASYEATAQQMKDAMIKPHNDNIDTLKKTKFKGYSFKEMNNFRHQQALLRNQHLEHQYLTDGESIPYLTDKHFSKDSLGADKLAFEALESQYNDEIPF